MVERLLQRLRVDAGEPRKTDAPARTCRAEFVSEQKGEIEDWMKSLWSEFFRAREDVAAAYLLCVRFPAQQQTCVALCLRADAKDRATLISFVSDAFRQMFDPDESLSLMFLSDDEERRARAVAMPFYAAGHATASAPRPRAVSFSHAPPPPPLDFAAAFDSPGDCASLRSAS